MIRSNPHEIVLLGIGNMTNIATLFNIYPDALSLLKGLYAMNGYFGKENLPEACYNWNSWADPHASQIVFAAQIAINRAITLEITDQLTIEAARAGELFVANSALMKSVFDFGNSWLESSNKLTLHDPLAAVSIFHPDVCEFEKGFVRVETQEESLMGATSFRADPNGNVEISREVDKKRFYEILSGTLQS
ncbi:nucleoside hydrolase [Paenibacillus amylolyticus]